VEVRLSGVYYRTEGSSEGYRVNVVGVWDPGQKEPLWVMGNLPCGELLGVYRERMKIEEAFRDLKSHLGMVNLMSKTRENAEKTWSSRDFCGFLFRGPKRAHVQVTPESPVLRGPQHHHRGQIHQAPLAGEDPNHPGPPLHLTDKPLQHIRALDVPLVALGKSR
jgi:hypothetical protein